MIIFKALWLVDNVEQPIIAFTFSVVKMIKKIIYTICLREAFLPFAGFFRDQFFQTENSLQLLNVSVVQVHAVWVESDVDKVTVLETCPKWLVCVAVISTRNHLQKLTRMKHILHLGKNCRTNTKCFLSGAVTVY